MASITMTASLLGKGNSTITRHSSINGSRRGLIIAKASRANEGSEKVNMVVVKNVNNSNDESSNNGRRELVFAAAAAAVCSISKVAMADDEPKRGTLEAKKKYAPVCITNPTARICRK